VSAPVQSMRIPGVIRKSGESQLQIDNFKWHRPLIYTHCLETIWNFLRRRFMRFNTLHHIHKMLQNCWRKSFLNTQTSGASGWWGLRLPGAPYQGCADPSPTFVPPNTKSWIRHWKLQLDNDDVLFVLDQLDFYSASSLKQQPAIR
jgi:hypothetical protein